MATSRICMLSKSLTPIATRALSPGNGQTAILANIKATRGLAYDSANATHKKIHGLVNNSKPVFVFMKGVPTAPSCGYSDAVCQILKAYEVEFDSYDVLEDDELRGEVKNYSDWPTIPQVYINGSFVGGCDTLLQMHQSGELEQMFKNINNNKKQQ